MFRLLIAYGLELHVAYSEHLWTFTVSGKNANGEPHTEIYQVQADGDAAAQREAIAAIGRYIADQNPVPV